MTNSIEARAGYIRAEAGLKLLESSVVASFSEPGAGYLDLLTADGRLRLALTTTAADNLMIDLQQFLRSTTQY